MNNNKILKFVNPIRSVKLRVFVVIMLAIIIPALASSIFIVNVTTKNYLKNRIDSFKANNTMPAPALMRQLHPSLNFSPTLPGTAITSFPCSNIT